jgi:hypothetical protein
MSEWITDRLPTEADGDEYYKVWWTSIDGEIAPCYYADIKTGEAWAPKPKPVPPKPYIKPEPQRWEPEKGERYYYVTTRAKACSGIYQEAYDCGRYTIDIYLSDMYNNGNLFQTSEQAEEAARRVRQLLLNYHKEINNA